MQRLVAKGFCDEEKIVLATEEDIPQWMELVHLVIDGFPHLDEQELIMNCQTEHICKYAVQMIFGILHTLCNSFGHSPVDGTGSSCH